MPAKIPKPTSWKVPVSSNVLGFNKNALQSHEESKESKLNEKPTKHEKTQKQASETKTTSKDIQTHLKSYLLAVKKTGCSSSTIRNYKSDINQFLDFTGSNDISSLRNKPKLLAFAHYQRDKGLKDNSIKRKLVSITQFKIWLKEQGLLTSEIPLQSIKANSLDSKKELAERQIIDQKQASKPKITENPEEIKRIKSKHPRSRMITLLNLLSLFLFLGGLAYFAYQQFGQALISMAYPSVPNAPNRILSYQGRLTNTAQSPISAPTAMEYRLYDANTGGSLLWSSNICTVDPDQDGIFNANLGAGTGGGSDDEDCGGAIDDSVFTENSNVWLEVEVASEVLTPRQPIRTVAYALNAETLQGLPPAEIATNSTILMMNSSGEVVLGTDNPVIKAASTSSGLTIEANQIIIQTSIGSDGDLILAPDGAGIVDIQSDLEISGDTTLASNVYIASPNSLIFGGTTALGEISSPTDSGAYLIGANDEFSYSASTTVQGVLKDLDTFIGGLVVGTSGLWTDSGTITHLTSTTDDFVLGGSTLLSSMFALDESAGNFYFGTDNSANPTFNFEATDGDSAEFGFNTNDSFYFNNARVGIGTATPDTRLHIYESANDEIGFSVQNPNTGTAANSFFSVGNSSVNSPWDALYVQHYGTNFTPNGLRIPSSTTIIEGGSGGLSVGTDNNANLSFFTNGVVNGADMTLTNTGNLGIGTTGPDAKLDSLATSGEQLRLTYTDGSVYSGFSVNSSGNLTIDSTGTKTTVADDFEILGDDLIMSTNTAGMLLIADGTSYSPTAVSGDVALSSGGVTTIGADKITEGMLKSVNSPTDEYCLSYETTTGDFEWQECGTGGGDSLWVDGTTYIYPLGDLPLGNPASAGSNKISGLYMADSGPLYFGTDNDVNFSFSGSTLSTALGSNVWDIGSSLLYLDGGNNKIGIGTNSPLATLDVRALDTDTPVASFSGATNLATLIVDQSGSGDIFTASSSGQTQFVITGDGNVGIGVNDPTSKLQIAGAVSTISNDSGDITIDSASGNVSFSGGNLINVNDGFFSGSVGIGTTTPARLLEILDASNPQLRLTHTDGSIYTDFQMNSNGDLVMNVDGVTNQLVLDNGGNVGIGTTTPDEKLTVNGSINAEKYYDFTNKTYFLDPAAVSTALNIAGNAVIGGHVLPSADDSVDLGSNTARWRDLYLGGDTLHIGTSTTDEGTISYNTTGNVLNFNTDSTTNGDMGFFGDLIYLDKSADNIGIGHTSPDQKLDILGDVAKVRTNLGGWYIYNTSNTFRAAFVDTGTYTGIFGDGNTGAAAIAINSSNFVGIGTTTPGYALDVNGNIHVGSTGDTVITSNQIYGNDSDTFHVNYSGTGATYLGNSSSSTVVGTGITVSAGGTTTLGVTTLTGALNADAGLTQDGHTILNGSDSWLRTAGATGWFNASYAGGWYMADASWIRNYNAKPLLITGNGTTAASFDTGSVTIGFGTTSPVGKFNIAHAYDAADARANHIYLTDPGNAALKGYIGINRWSAGGANAEYLSIEGVEEAVHWMNVVLGADGGNVGVGIKNPTHKLQVTGTAGLSTGTAWTNTSDFRLKDVESDLNASSLEQIMALNPISFRWNDLHHEKFGSTGSKLNYGFIAQEVEEVLPHMITTDAEGYKWYNPSGFEALLTAGIQEQQKQINTLAQIVNEQGSSLNSSGQLSISGNSTTTYTVATPTGSATRIAAFADIFVARLNAGLVNTKELVAQTVRVAQKLIAKEVVTEKINTPNNQPLEIAADATISGDLKVAENLEVKGSTKLAQLNVESASISGQLSAQEIQTNNLLVASARINSIESKLANLENATVSGTLYANNIEAENINANVISGLQERLTSQIEQTLTEPSLLASIFGDQTAQTEEYLQQLAQEFNSSTSTSSATIDPLEDENGDLTLIADNAFIKQYFEVNGNAYVATSLKVGENLLIGDNTVFGANFISYQPNLPEGEDFTFSIQPTGLGKITLLAGLMQLDSNGFVSINGSLKVAGALEVAEEFRAKGTLLTNLIGSDRPGEDIRVQLASLEGEDLDVRRSNFEFIDENQTPVASFSASGDLSLSGSLRLSQNLNIASNSGELVSGSNSAGQAVLTAGQTEVVISSNKVEENSMIYVTPLNSTNNQVLYVKNKTTDNEETEENEAKFTVAIDYALGQDVTFNWWIIQIN